MLDGSRVTQNIFNRRLAEANHCHVPRAAPRIHAVHVDVRHSPFDRVERMTRVVLRAEQPFFFRGDGKE